MRVLVRNPLIWQQVCQGVRRARHRGSLYLPEEDSLLSDSVSRAVAEADRQALTSLDFACPLTARADTPRPRPQSRSARPTARRPRR